MTREFDPSASRNARIGQFAALFGFLLVLFLPTPSDMAPAAHRLAAVAVAMAVLWLTQSIPLGATSLIPLAAFPLLGIQSTEAASKAYMNDSVFLFLGGFVIALGIERWGLHRRIAFHVVRVLGSSPRRIVLGFAVATGFISMWISNTASALLMIPIAMALLKSLEELGTAGEEPVPEKRSLWAPYSFGTALMLAIAYSASLGGLTTLVGTPPNLVYREVLSTMFPGAPETAVGPWMISFVPLGASMILVMWLIVTWRLRPIPGTESLTRAFFTERLRELGRPSPAQRRMAFIFAGTAFLWLTRVPLSFGGAAGSGFHVPGWGPWITQWLTGLGLSPAAAATMVGDATVAILMAVAMFFIPAGRSIPENDKTGEVDKTDKPLLPAERYNLMDWPTANRLPWEILLLFGGGFALAGGFEATGLSNWVGQQFASAFNEQPAWVVVVAACAMLTFLTELTSNTATCNIMLPILGPAAVELGVDPRLVMTAAALSASCAFMLPVATPPNALVFGTGRITVWQMARAGLLLNLLGIVLVSVSVLWIYAPLTGIDLAIMPDWAILSSGNK